MLIYKTDRKTCESLQDKELAIFPPPLPVKKIINLSHSLNVMGLYLVKLLSYSIGYNKQNEKKSIGLS